MADSTTKLVNTCTHMEECSITTMGELLDTVRMFGDAQFMAGWAASEDTASDLTAVKEHFERGQSAYRAITHFAIFHGAVVPF